MTYKQQYYKIIQHRQANPLEDEVYCEKHHIYPKSLFPQFARAKWNIVKLTAEEHYTCHYLLVKWFEEAGEREAYEKMVCAWNRITHSRHGLIVNAEQYAELKEKHSEVLRNSEKAKESIKKATEASRHSEKAKESHRQAIKKAIEAARKSEKHKAVARQNFKKAREASLNARRKPFEIDGIRFERQTDAAKHFGVGHATISNWLNGKRKTSRVCKYI